MENLFSCGVRTASCFKAYVDDNAAACIIDEETAKNIFDTFLSEKFEGGRHQRRIDKI